MVTQLKEMPAAQDRLITLAQRAKTVALMAFQPPTRQALASRTASKT
jgi:hypothetical protein